MDSASNHNLKANSEAYTSLIGDAELKEWLVMESPVSSETAIDVLRSKLFLKNTPCYVSLAKNNSSLEGRLPHESLLNSLAVLSLDSNEGQEKATPFR